MSAVWPSDGSFATVPAALEAIGQRTPDALCLRDDAGPSSRVYTYGEMLRRMALSAAALHARGATAGDVVAVVAPNGAFLVQCFFGAQRCGAIPIVVEPPSILGNLDHYRREAVELLNQVGARGLVVAREYHNLAALGPSDVPTLRYVLHEDAVPAWDELPRLRLPLPRDPARLSHLQHTSGSTGRKRPVMVTHGNVLDCAHAVALAAALGPDDRFVTWLPLSHDMGLVGALLAPLLRQRPVLLMSPLQFLVRPATWLRAISDFRGTVTFAPTFGYRRCVSVVRNADLEGVDLSPLRAAICGAEPVLPATIEAFERRFRPCGLRAAVIYPAYGLAECTLPVTSRALHDPPRVDEIDYDLLTAEKRAVPAGGSTPSTAICSVGRPLPGTTLAIVDAAGSPLPERKVGDIVVGGRGVTPGYYRDEEETARMLRAGWVHTGDCGYLAGGELFVTGRRKHVIIKAGRNFHPEDFECTVADLPEVRASAAFGVTSPALGTERIVLMVETRHLDHHRRQQVAGACHRRIRSRLGVSVDEVLPIGPPYTIVKTTTGKLQRLANQRLYHELKGICDESGRRFAVT